MLSKNTIKYITSLQFKKYRDKENVFIVEGEKMVKEALNSSFNVRLITGVPEILNRLNSGEVLKYESTFDILSKISTLTTSPQVLAVVEKPNFLLSENPDFILALDDVQDPGNVGTLLRTCNWFGIQNVLLSDGCADVFNPKVVQATMGAIFHISTKRCNLATEIQNWKKKGYVIAGTFLDGVNVYKESLGDKTIIIAGNEGKGISSSIADLVDKKLHIPSFASKHAQESLNVSIATAIVLSEYKREQAL